MKSLSNIQLLTLAGFFVLYVPQTSTAGSCFFRCGKLPNLLDYQFPVGCYCHRGCGGKLRCCADKVALCDNGCTVPKKINKASVVGLEKLTYTKGQTITYECDFRYEISGSATRTCMGNNIWTPGPPKCKYLRYVCSPPRISNGYYAEAKKQYKRWESITVGCDTGYELDGASRMTCWTYRWNEPTPYCNKDRCNTTTYCSKDATCKNTRYVASCRCNEGFTGSGISCRPIPCYKHTCSSKEVCVDRGDDTGNYDCECKEGYIRDGESCVVDPCADNNCHEHATCSVVDGSAVCSCNEGYKGDGTVCEVDPCFENDCHENAFCEVKEKDKSSCYCGAGYKGNGTHCEAAKCNPGELYTDGETIVGMCDQCEDTCCDETKLRECRICIHMKCNGGEVCGEEGLSRVPTVCIDKKCYENRDSGFTVETPSNVHCLDSKGLQQKEKSCCWVGE